MVKAVILVDYQEEWRDKRSGYYIGDCRKAIAAARTVLGRARGNGVKIIFTQHIEPSPTAAFREGSKGARIVSELEPLWKEKVIVKNAVSPFYGTGLDSYLKDAGIDRLVVAGIMTNLCVRSTVSDAYDRGMLVTIVKDACASKSGRMDRFTLTDLKETRPEIKIVAASNPHFLDQ
jgi:nicotinamidase-related amidase